jgi:hypothetical protein
MGAVRANRVAFAQTCLRDSALTHHFSLPRSAQQQAGDFRILCCEQRSMRAIFGNSRQ